MHNDFVWRNIIQELSPDNLDYLYLLTCSVESSLPLDIPEYYPIQIKQTITKINQLDQQRFESFKIYLAGIKYGLEITKSTPNQQNNNVVIASQTVNLVNTSSSQPIANFTFDPNLILSLAEKGYLSEEFMTEMMHVVIKYLSSLKNNNNPKNKQNWTEN